MTPKPQSCKPHIYYSSVLHVPLALAKPNNDHHQYLSPATTQGLLTQAKRSTLAIPTLQRIRNLIGPLESFPMLLLPCGVFIGNKCP